MNKKSALRYIPQFKQKVLDFLELETSTTDNEKQNNKKRRKSFAAAAEKFDVHPSTISDWVHEAERQSAIRYLHAKHETQVIVASQESFTQPDACLTVSSPEEKALKLLKTIRNNLPSDHKSVNMSGLKLEIYEGIEMILNEMDEEDGFCKSASWLRSWCKKLGQDLRNVKDNSECPSNSETATNSKGRIKVTAFISAPKFTFS